QAADGLRVLCQDDAAGSRRHRRLCPHGAGDRLTLLSLPPPRERVARKASQVRDLGPSRVTEPPHPVSLPFGESGQEPPRLSPGPPQGRVRRRTALQLPRSSLYTFRRIFWRFPMPLGQFLPVVPLLVLSLLPAAAQDRVVPTSPGQLTLSYAPVVKRVTPAVV